MKEFITRTITAFFLASLAYVAIIFLPSIYFSILIFIVIGTSVFEFLRLAKPKNKSFSLIYINGFLIGLYFTFGIPSLESVLFINLVSFGVFFLLTVKSENSLNFFVRDFGINFLSIFYLFFPLYFLFRLREIGPNYLIFLIFVIAIGDSGAYFIGRMIGKNKIYPVASPKKSLEGIIAAVITAGVSGLLSIKLFPIDIDIKSAIVTGAVIGFLSQVSDPIESLFKRSAGEKDSGELLPGHGGFLDRIDSYIFCAPALYFILLNVLKVTS